MEPVYFVGRPLVHEKLGGQTKPPVRSPPSKPSCRAANLGCGQGGSPSIFHGRKKVSRPEKVNARFLAPGQISKKYFFTVSPRACILSWKGRRGHEHYSQRFRIA